jgi:photosystem II stability/assembly factor-like uncharacterized protein
MSSSLIPTAAGRLETAGRSGIPRMGGVIGGCRMRRSRAVWRRCGLSTTGAAGSWADGRIPTRTAPRGLCCGPATAGQRWEALPRLSLPALKGVKFFDLRHGWALGSASALYPVGVFRTEDGGLSWSSVPATGGAGWLSGDFLDAQSGVVAGRQPTVARVQQRGTEIIELPLVGRSNGSLRAVRQPGSIVLQAGHLVRHPVGWSGTAAWCCGRVMVAAVGIRPPGSLPGGMADYYDFQSVAVLGQQVWIAGSPGTRVLHSADGGQTWQVLRHGQPLPVRALTFLDAHRGWAVGAMGTILATRDGGRTWQVQRRGGERAAWLSLASQAENLPLELVVNLSGNEGFLGVVEVLNAAAPADDGNAGGFRRGASPRGDLDARWISCEPCSGVFRCRWLGATARWHPSRRLGPGVRQSGACAASRIPGTKNPPVASRRDPHRTDPSARRGRAGAADQSDGVVRGRSRRRSVGRDRSGVGHGIDALDGEESLQFRRPRPIGHVELDHRPVSTTDWAVLWPTRRSWASSCSTRSTDGRLRHWASACCRAACPASWDARTFSAASPCNRVQPLGANCIRRPPRTCGRSAD